MGNLGTYGDLVAAFARLFSGGGFETASNFLFIAAFAGAGYSLGRWLSRFRLSFALVAAAVMAPAFAGGYAAWYVMNLGTAYLAYLFAVGAEAHARLSGR